MKKFQIITKKGHEKCKDVKKLLKSEKVDAYCEEWNLDKPEIVERLTKDPKFTQNFCSVDDCIPELPIFRIDGEYHFKEMYDTYGITKLKNLLK